MAKSIRMTDSLLDMARKAFEAFLETSKEKGKIPDGRLSFSTTFSVEQQKATLLYSPMAWLKQSVLVDCFDKEVAWHGVAHRVDTEDGDNTYLITDIVVYPQTVGPATVEMDVEKYGTWLMENDEDERFKSLFMQGHSHVRMATNPSGVDLNHQEEILSMMGEEDFYIFVIWNKSGSRNVKIYDMKKNIMFEDKDVTVKVPGFDGFLDEAKKIVVTPLPKYQYQEPYYRTPTYEDSKPYDPLSSKTKHGGKSEKKGEKPKTMVGEYPSVSDDGAFGAASQLYLMQ